MISTDCIYRYVAKVLEESSSLYKKVTDEVKKAQEYSTKLVTIARHISRFNRHPQISLIFYNSLTSSNVESVKSDQPDSCISQLKMSPTGRDTSTLDSQGPTGVVFVKQIVEKSKRGVFS